MLHNIVYNPVAGKSCCYLAVEFQAVHASCFTSENTHQVHRQINLDCPDLPRRGLNLIHF